MTLETFRFEIDAEGIALIIFDVPGRSMNTLTAAVLRDVALIVARIKTDPAIRGAVITSGKASGFCAGADLIELEAYAGGDATLRPDERLRRVYRQVHAFNEVLRELETCGKPIAAAINGLALGAGLELCLATHYRVVGDHTNSQFGLPQSKVGLLPGGGGTQRLPRLIGAQRALEIMQSGNAVRAQEAVNLGFVHKLVSAGDEVSAAKTWLRAKGDPVQPWDKKEYKVPGGAPQSPEGAGIFTIGNALMHKQTYGNIPAQRFIMSCVFEGLQVPIDAGLRIETRYVAKLLTMPTAKTMIRSLFRSVQDLNKGIHRPVTEPPGNVRRVALLGPGMMGADIAFAQAMAGIETVLLDTTLEAAETCKAGAAKRLAKQVERGEIGHARAGQILGLLEPTADYGALSAADLVIEARDENHGFMAAVMKRAEAQLDSVAVFASMTSTVSISRLAEASERPGNVVGIHIFPSVDGAGLVEIVRARQTSDHAIAVAMDYARAVKKTPIVVNDSRGFYISRCLSAYLAEGQAMLVKGIAPAIIENVGRMAGMSRGPLELADDGSLHLAYEAQQQKRLDLGDAYVSSAADDLIALMVEREGRCGRKTGRGFYDYPAEGPAVLWTGLAGLVPVTVASAEPPLVEQLKQRFLYRQAVEAVRCLAERVIADPRDGDVGAIIGWGFAPWTGGPFSLIDTVGVPTFVEACDRMAQAHGARFALPQLLRDMVAASQSFYGPPAPA